MLKLRLSRLSLSSGPIPDIYGPITSNQKHLDLEKNQETLPSKNTVMREGVRRTCNLDPSSRLHLCDRRLSVRTLPRVVDADVKSLFNEGGSDSVSLNLSVVAPHYRPF